MLKHTFIVVVVRPVALAVGVLLYIVLPRRYRERLMGHLDMQLYGRRY